MGFLRFFLFRFFLALFKASDVRWSALLNSFERLSGLFEIRGFSGDILETDKLILDLSFVFYIFLLVFDMF